MPEAVLNVISMIKDSQNLNKQLTELVKVSGYSYVHLARLFKEHVNMTLNQYFVTARMNCARLLLENTNKNILEISSQVGYSSLSHFNHTFKNFFKITPTKFRKNWQNFYNSFEEL